MTAPEIVRIVATVGLVQLVCDGLAHWRVYSKVPYHRSLERLARCQAKVSQLKAKQDASKLSSTTTTAPGKGSSKQNDRQAKSLQRALDDQAAALADVAQRHTAPSVLTSLVFLLLLRVLGAENQGQMFAVLPFVPWSLVQRVTARGLQFVGGAEELLLQQQQASATGEAVVVPAQAASFFVIYLLTTLSVKYYIHQLVSTKPPVGAESLMSMVDSPQGHQIMRAVGIDPIDLKVE